jgi:hypothetical protein
MMDRLSTMRQDIDNCAQRCENLGSVENLDEADLPENTPIYNLAEQVNTDLQQATGEVRYLYLYVMRFPQIYPYLYELLLI